MHLAGNGRAVVASRDLLDMERVHIGPQADGALAWQPALQRADDAGPGDALGDI
jgi:hypothetical protein